MRTYGMKLWQKIPWSFAFTWPEMEFTKKELLIIGATKLRLVDRRTKYVTGFAIEFAFLGFGLVFGWAQFRKDVSPPRQTDSDFTWFEGEDDYNPL